MANIYVRSTDGSDADNGSTWALAKATLAGAAAIDAAGDTIYVSQNHAESSASAQTIALAGTAASPVRVICGNDAAEPPTAVATTATITSSFAGSAITVSGSGIVDNCTFDASAVSGSTSYPWTVNIGTTDSITFNNVSFKTGSTSSNQRFNSNFNTLVTFNNCKFGFGHTGGAFRGYANFIFNGGSLISGYSAITGFLAVGNSNTQTVVCKDFDFSLAASTLTLASSGSSHIIKAQFINCKLPAAWSGSLASSLSSPASRVSMYNCDSGATNYRLWIETYAGSIKSETTLVKTGGASDGTTALSWKLTTTANANEYVATLITDDMAIWIDSTGSSKTITVDILHNSATALTDAEVWLEIDYLGSSAQPLGTPASDKRATVLTTATNQASSSASWVTTGLANPNMQKLEVTFTPQMKGFVYARVCLAKASYTIYVDPKPVIY